MNGKVIEMRNRWGYPVQVQVPRPHPKPPDRFFQRLILFTLSVGVVLGVLATLVVQECAR